MKQTVDFVFLLKAIKEQRPLDLVVSFTGNKHLFFSRFLAIESEEQQILIEKPASWPKTRQEESATVIFRLSGFRLEFDTLCRGEGSYQEEGLAPQEALLLAWPEQIADSNRRSSHRLTVNLDDFVNVRYVRLEQTPENRETASRQELEGVNALMVDISENGVGLRLDKRSRVEEGDWLKLRFNLGNRQQQEIEVEGVVRNVRIPKPGNQIICGVQFISRQSKSYRKGIQRLARYIMSRNRDKLQFQDVDKPVSDNFLVQKITAGEFNPEILSMLLQREFSLSEEEYLEAIVHVAHLEGYQKRAAEELSKIPLDIKRQYVERVNANHRVVNCILREALKHDLSGILEKIIGNPGLPVEFILKIAKEGTAEHLNMILRLHRRLTEYPEIIEVMETNPALPGPVLKRLNEIKSKMFTREWQKGVKQE